MAANTRNALFVALATFALALAIRLLGVGLREPWLDEVYSQFAISREWYGLAADRISRGHSPLYYALMKAFGIPGADVAAMRAASSVFDALGAGIVAGALALHVGRPAALFFGFLYAWSPVAIHWAQNARPYGLLIFFVSIGLAGAIGLLATLGREGAVATRRQRRLFGFGFSMASLTITAGIFAFLATALLPFALPRTRRDKAFLKRWKKALKVPAVVSVLAYFAMSGPHIARQVDGYWAEKYNPLGLDGLGRLWSSMLSDGGLAEGIARLGGPQAANMPLIWAGSALFVAFLVLGLARIRYRPALIAPACLMAGYTLILLCVSIWTSVLVARYFLPPWIALLALAGTGMAAARARTRWSWLAIAPLMLLFAFSGYFKATQPGAPRDRSLEPVAEIINRVPPETVSLLIDKTGGVRSELILELWPHHFDRPELDRMWPRSFTLSRLTDALESGQNSFAYFQQDGLDEALQEGAPEPRCLYRFDDWVLAYWGEANEVCAP
ncbi:hypothetical protein [Aliiruegeria lutimaris]|uniref:Dolichyl-phosphate-mannose-protein mannosyltransferase n=1 Tax=Aliiruegeria lutimaris TaxID=571298 RepID=A0A1G9C5V1_9RHOB|nr:hypothetical protein [Aliiruegeria lutimaris]SDK47053.1 hypothetical protein SAMN04488026_104217 [Aliiruegeria lutimaris]